MYDTALADIESVLGSVSFQSENFEVIPANYDGDIRNETEYGVVSFLPSTSSPKYGGAKDLSGLVIIKVFVEFGKGQSRLMQIADILDNYFEHKKINNRTELGASFMNVEGQDPMNKSLYSGAYTIPFKLYGE